MKRVVVAFMEEDAALAAARAGQVDIAFTAAVYSDQEIADYELLACETVDSRGISLPTPQPGGTKEGDGGVAYPVGNAVTSDIAVRRAINYGVDRETMIKNVINGYGTPAYSVCDKSPWGSPDMKVETDVAYAKQLLDEAGWLPAPMVFAKRTACVLHSICITPATTRCARRFRRNSRIR